MTYRTFLFLTFQICTQFAPIFERCTQPAPISLQNSHKRFCKNNICRALSSSNVDNLKASMGFQLSTDPTNKKVIYIDWISSQLQFVHKVRHEHLTTREKSLENTSLMKTLSRDRNTHNLHQTVQENKKKIKKKSHKSKIFAKIFGNTTNIAYIYRKNMRYD